ncbi:hypothetical protein Taro_007482 [Colocasia esculenta]|uniref:Uncharacterized protein n=1 Tax=Colocasia esculenta TaxID=4460 RepID=A0A843U0H3_COLES|nr:hypothetical protein [Colocasia esculenta]
METLGNKELAAVMVSAGDQEKTKAEEKTLHGAVAAVVEGNDVQAVPSPPMDLRAVERILGYTFGNKELVERALTHASYYYRPDTGEVTGPSYERLEFVGDAVLNCVVARALYWEYEELPPGPLTRLRSANVDNEKLARVAVGSGLHRYLRHKAPYLFGQIEEFRKTMSDYPLHSNGLLDPPKVLADVVEALLGAVFIDSDNIEAVWKVFEGLSEPLIRLETLGKHPTSELYELCQKKGMAVSFQTAAWKETSAVEVLVNGKLAGRGTYGQKKEVAQNRAAKAALDHLKMVFANGGGSVGQSHPEELQDHMLGREEINNLSDHTSSGESDDDGKTILPNPEDQQDHMPGREEMNNMSDHTSSGESDDVGKTAVLPNPEELQGNMLGLEEMSTTSDHTSSGDSDNDGKTTLLPNPEELQRHMLGREEMNTTSDHTSSGDFYDDGETTLLPNPEEHQDHMLGREEMNNMSDHTSSRESDGDPKTAVLPNPATYCAKIS